MCISNKNCGCSCNQCNSGFNCCVEYTEDGCSTSTPLKCTNYSGEDISCGDLVITRADSGDDAIKKLADKICSISTDGDGDKFVKISATDTTSSYLMDKLVESQFIGITKINPNLNEQLRIDLKLQDLLTAVNAQLPTDKYVRITGNDKVSGYLIDKLVSGDGVKLTVTNNSSNEALRISVALALSTNTGNQLTFDQNGKLFVPPMPVYYPVLGKVVGSSITTKGWFNLDKSDVSNPFYGVGSQGSGSSGFASFEGPVNGWVLIGQDGINTFTGQTFDLYGALKNPTGGLYPPVRIWHSGNVTKGANIDFTENSTGQIVISASGQRFGYPGEDVTAIQHRDVQFNDKHFHLDGIGDLNFKTTIASNNNYNYSELKLTSSGGGINYYKKNVSTDNYGQIGIIDNANNLSYPAGAQMSAIDNISQISNTITVSADKIVIGEKYLNLPSSVTNIQLKRIANTVTANVLYYDSSTGSVTYGAAPVGGSSGGSSLSFDSGLTRSGDNVQLGGRLLHDTRINTDVYRFIVSNDGVNTNGPETVMEVQRNTSGTLAQNGIGASLDFGIETTLGIATVANRLTSTWTDVTDATRTSEFLIRGVNNGFFKDLVRLPATGQLILPNYTLVDSFVGTAVAGLGYDSTGKVIAIPLSSGGSGITGITANNGLTATTGTNTQLGGSLLHPTTIVAGSNMLDITSTASRAFQVISTGNAAAHFGGANVGISAYGSGVPIFSTNTSSVNYPVNTIVLTAGDGNSLGYQGSGSIIATQLQSTTGTTIIAGTQVISWTNNPVQADASAKYELNLKNGNTFSNKLVVDSSGLISFPAYTSTSSFSGTVAGLLGFDSSGNVVTTSASGGGGAISRFAFTGEDNLAAENRLFDLSGRDFMMSNIGHYDLSTPLNNEGEGYGTYTDFHISTANGGYITHYTWDGTQDNEALIVAYKDGLSSPSEFKNTASIRATDYVAHKSSSVQVYADMVVMGANTQAGTIEPGAAKWFYKGLPSGESDKVLYINSTTGEITAGNASGGSSITTDNGLTLIGSNIQLGGSLLHNTTITQSSYSLTLTGDVDPSVLVVNNTGSSGLKYGISATSSSVSGTGLAGTGGAYGTQGVSSGGTGVFGSGGSVGVQGNSASGVGGVFGVNPSSTNTSVEVLQLQRNTSGTPAADMGGYINMTAETSTGNPKSAGRVAWKWSDPTDATRTGDVEIWTTNSATSTRKFAVTGIGDIVVDNMRSYANDAAADADTTLPVGALYKLNGSRIVYHKPVGL